MEQRGWQQLDVILFSGDAYVDHPAFGVAVIGRLLESLGLRVAIVPQPDWHGDYRDFRKLGRPRYFFGISPGAMDSMVNKYTAARRLRSEDAYSPDGRHDKRPVYPTIVYTRILKQLWPDAPVVLGGIEASMRRLTHYDYWQQRLRPSILIDSGADLITYGLGEQPTEALVRLIDDKLLHGRDDAFASSADLRQLLHKYPIPQTVRIVRSEELGVRSEELEIRNEELGVRSSRVQEVQEFKGSRILPLSKGESPQREGVCPVSSPYKGDGRGSVLLHSHASCLADRRCYAENFRIIEEESNSLQPRRIIQEAGGGSVGSAYIIVEPPFPPMTTKETDRTYDLPYTRLPHPKYQGKRIPAYEMIRHSVTIHRGCFGGCAFCTISAHQGKFIMSRSKESILREVRQITRMPDFRGTITDLGGPSANMYMMGGRDKTLCQRCRRPSCIHPAVCRNLNTDHGPLVDLYRAVDAVPGVKHTYIGSGVRYDLILHAMGEESRVESCEKKALPLNKGESRLRGGGVLPGEGVCPVSSPYKGDGRGSAYLEQLITRHVSGRLKVAPEHTEDHVLQLMRKPSFELYRQFSELFHSVCHRHRLPYQIVPYFISSHPGCTERDMAALARKTQALGLHLEQVQDFTPTPMTVSTATWYSGLHPYTLKPVFSEHNPAGKQRQRSYFFKK